METQVANRTNGNGQAPDPKRIAREQFARTVTAYAERELVNLFGSDIGKQAAARVASAFRAAAATAKDPEAFWQCTAESVAACMATVAFTQVSVGGPWPGAYLIPKRINIAPKGENKRFVWTLNLWMNHRGVKALARRSGQAIETIPYFQGDAVEIVRGRDWRVDVIEGDCPDRDDPALMEGIVYYVTDIASGALLAARKMSKGQIAKRRLLSDGIDKDTGEAKFGTWRDWPMEMAEKTAIKFAAGRGDVVFDDVANMALSRDAEAGPVIDGNAIEVPNEAPRGAGARVKERLSIGTNQVLEGESREEVREEVREAVPIQSAPADEEP